MIGIILWCDSSDQKAVIWCEDQGDLAFLSSPETIDLPDLFFEVGDVVRFDVASRKNMRWALNPSRVGASLGSGLADDLHAVGKNNPSAAPQDVKIIPFRLDHAPRTTPPATPDYRRRG